MIKFLKSMMLLIFFGAIFTSCTAELIDDPEEDIIPASIETVYTGILTYSGSNGDLIENNNGTATITKNGSTYSITFSDNVPSISGLKFKDNNGSYATIGTSGSQAGININGDNIEISVSEDGNNWAFSGAK